MSEVLTPQTVETKSGVNSKNKPWTVFKWTFVEGPKASTFDQKTNSFLTANIGRAVNVEIVQTEKGKDLIGAWPIDGEQPAMKQRITVEKKSGDDYMRERNPRESKTIARQAALKAAANVYAGSGADHRAVLAIADEFIEWVFREEVGVRHMAAGHTQADVTAEAKAIVNDRPADTLLKEMVVGMIPSANADAKAVLKNYGLNTVKDVNAKLTERVAKLFLEANGGAFDPDRVSTEVPF